VKFVLQNNTSPLLDLVGFRLAVSERLQVYDFLYPFFIKNVVIASYSFRKSKTNQQFPEILEPDVFVRQPV
jgi:hypothetical protein